MGYLRRGLTHIRRLVSAARHEDFKLHIGVLTVFPHAANVTQGVFKRRERRVERLAEIVHYVRTVGHRHVLGLRHEDACHQVRWQHSALVGERSGVEPRCAVAELYAVDALHVGRSNVERFYKSRLRAVSFLLILVLHAVLYHQRVVFQAAVIIGEIKVGVAFERGVLEV